jgi:hypothetical protein
VSSTNCSKTLWICFRRSWINLLISAEKCLKRISLIIWFCNAAWKLTFPTLEYYCVYIQLECFKITRHFESPTFFGNSERFLNTKHNPFYKHNRQMNSPLLAEIFRGHKFRPTILSSSFTVSVLSCILSWHRNAKFFNGFSWAEILSSMHYVCNMQLCLNCQQPYVMCHFLMQWPCWSCVQELMFCRAKSICK